LNGRCSSLYIISSALRLLDHGALPNPAGQNSLVTPPCTIMRLQALEHILTGGVKADAISTPHHHGTDPVIPENAPGHQRRLFVDEGTLSSSQLVVSLPSILASLPAAGTRSLATHSHSPPRLLTLISGAKTFQVEFHGRSTR